MSWERGHRVQWFCWWLVGGYKPSAAEIWWQPVVLQMCLVNCAREEVPPSMSCLSSGRASCSSGPQDPTLSAEDEEFSLSLPHNLCEFRLWGRYFQYVVTQLPSEVSQNESGLTDTVAVMKQTQQVVAWPLINCRQSWGVNEIPPRAEGTIPAQRLPSRTCVTPAWNRVRNLSLFLFLLPLQLLVL